MPAKQQQKQSGPSKRTLKGEVTLKKDGPSRTTSVRKVSAGPTLETLAKKVSQLESAKRGQAEQLVVGVKASTQGHMPKYQDHKSATADVYAKVLGDPIRMGPRASALVDTGLTLDIPEGFRAVVELDADLACQGIIADGTSFVGKADVQFRVRNVGRAIVPILNLSRVGQLRFEPVHRAAFKTEE